VHRLRDGDPRLRSPASEQSRPSGLTPGGLVALAGMIGNRAMAALASRRMVARNPDKDAPSVAAKLYGKAERREIDNALTILRTAQAMGFYVPVKELALTGRVLNPEGLAVSVSEFHAKAREDPVAAQGIVAELLHALAAAQANNYVQLGGWRPDPLQTRMQDLAKQYPKLKPYLDDLAQTHLPLAQGWGGDVVVWTPGSEGALSASTFQHKVIDSDKAGTFETELKKAATQLAGQNFEKPLPGRKVAELLIAHPKNPLHEEPLADQMLHRVAEILMKHRHGQKFLIE